MYVARHDIAGPLASHFVVVFQLPLSYPGGGWRGSGGCCCSPFVIHETSCRTIEFRRWKLGLLAQVNGRIALSTKTLEPEPGDMIKNPQKVYDMAEVSLQHLSRRYMTTPTRIPIVSC